MDHVTPDQAHSFLERHAALMAASFRRWTGRELLEPGPAPLPDALFEAPFTLVSHGTEPDPIFNYGNQTALRLFQMEWEEFTRLPSRLSAEPVHRDDRQRLMDEVTRNGFISDYRGVRVSRSGRRFFIEQAVVWNLVDDVGLIHGQAAMFRDWRFLDANEGRGT